MLSHQPTGFVRIEQRATGPVAYSQIRRADGTEVRRIGPVHVERRAGKWTAKRSKARAGVLTLSEAEQELRRRIANADASAGLTFGRAVADWLDHIENVENRRRSTVRDYQSTANVHLLPHFGADTTLADLSYGDIEAFRSKLLRDGKLAKRTVQKTLILLGGVFKCAMRLHGFPSNPAALVKKGSPPHGEVVYFTMAEVETIAGKASAQDADLFRVMARIGLRRGEMVALHWRDVDFAGEQVHVRANYVAGLETLPKDHEVRDVPMQEGAQTILARLSLRELFVDPEDLVFPNVVGGHLNPDELSKRFTAARVAAKLADHPGTLENLRHTFATHAADTPGVRPQDVQRWLGHSDLKTTLRYVGTLDKRDAAKLLTARFDVKAETV
jgi:integrase